jgi:hypothetical protein
METSRKDDAKAGVVREAVAVFDGADTLADAVQALLEAGFDRAELSLLAGERSIEGKLGHAYRRTAELEDEPKAPRAAFVGDHSLAEARTGVIGGLAYVGAMLGAGAVVASGGTLAGAAAAAAAAGGGGGLLGGLAARLIGRERAERIQQQLEHGGLLLWVDLRDAAHEQRAVDILRRAGGRDAHVHELPIEASTAENPLAGIEFDPWLPDARV